MVTPRRTVAWKPGNNRWRAVLPGWCSRNRPLDSGGRFWGSHRQEGLLRGYWKETSACGLEKFLLSSSSSSSTSPWGLSSWAGVARGCFSGPGHSGHQLTYVGRRPHHHTAPLRVFEVAWWVPWYKAAHRGPEAVSNGPQLLGSLAIQDHYLFQGGHMWANLRLLVQRGLLLMTPCAPNLWADCHSTS